MCFFSNRTLTSTGLRRTEARGYPPGHPQAPRTETLQRGGLAMPVTRLKYRPASAPSCHLSLVLLPPLCAHQVSSPLAEQLSIPASPGTHLTSWPHPDLFADAFITCSPVPHLRAPAMTDPHGLGHRALTVQKNGHTHEDRFLELSGRPS